MAINSITVRKPAIETEPKVVLNGHIVIHFTDDGTIDLYESAAAFSREKEIGYPTVIQALNGYQNTCGGGKGNHNKGYNICYLKDLPYFVNRIIDAFNKQLERANIAEKKVVESESKIRQYEETVNQFMAIANAFKIMNIAG